MSKRKFSSGHQKGNPKESTIIEKGLALHNAGKVHDAVTLYLNGLKGAPHSKEIHYYLANSLKKIGQSKAAVDHYQKAIALGLNLPEALNNLGIAFKDLKRYEEAGACYVDALKLNPFFVLAYANLGYLFIETGETDKAILPLREAIRIDPNYVDAHWLLSHVLLLHGEYKEGWREYEWRWRKPEFALLERNFTQPQWRGEDLTGKTILLWTEQGLGDALQFIRFALRVKHYGGRVVLECQPSLSRLLNNTEGIDAIIDRGQPLPDFDIQCSLLSLPMVLDQPFESIQATVPYVFIDPTIAAHWKTLFANDQALKVGVVWSGNPNHPDDRNRSINPEFFRLLSGLPGLSLYSLQKGLATAESLGLPLKDYTFQLSDLAETGGLVESLDLVITVDTSIAHLAGALGKEVWTLLPFNADWRWLTGRTDSPWYSTMKLFRQSTRGDWRDVFKNVANELFLRIESKP